jgi:cilla- and flagella-associated protein
MVALTEQIVRGKTRVEHLTDVRSLNLWGQDIDDVSVLQKLPDVEVLSLSVNRISSLRDFRHCRRLAGAILVALGRLEVPSHVSENTDC